LPNSQNAPLARASNENTARRTTGTRPAPCLRMEYAPPSRIPPSPNSTTGSAPLTATPAFAPRGAFGRRLPLRAPDRLRRDGARWSRRHRAALHSQASLGTRHDAGRPRVQGDGLAQRARHRLELRLDHVVRVRLAA